MMSPDVITSNERSVEPLCFEFDYRGLAPSLGWVENETSSIGTNYRDPGEWRMRERGDVQLQAFIHGMLVNAGASASWQPRVIGMVVGQGSTGGVTFVELDADKPPVADRMRYIAGTQEEIESRLRSLSGLRMGWLDGEGVPPTQGALATARQLIWLLLVHGVDRPRLAPTPEGGVEAEWTVGTREVSVTFEPDGSLYGNAVDVSTGEISEPELNADDHETVADFVLARA